MNDPAPIPSLPILIVDDEPIVLAALKETLLRERYEVVATTSPLQALEYARQRPFGVIISDHRMPEMAGLDFLIESKQHQPNASRILITAVLSLPTIVDSINKGEIFRFIAKPWLREELVATVKNAVQRFELITRNESLTAETRRLNADLSAANHALHAKVGDLETSQSALALANRQLAANFSHSLDLCHRILTTFDPLLGGQTKALVDIAERMAETEYFNDQEKHVLRVSAGVCDLGLIGVPREMLRTFRASPDKLGERERNILRSHPIYGQTLASFVDDLAAVGETVRAHHERWDGAGYPDGLSRQAIPWTARCLAVAVGFVESGLKKEQAIESVLQHSGTAFDPEAVRLFLKVTHLVQLPRQVREILLEDLQPGMVLAHGIYSPHGLLLIGEGQTLNPGVITKIKNHDLINPITQRLLVYG